MSVVTKGLEIREVAEIFEVDPEEIVELYKRLLNKEGEAVLYNHIVDFNTIKELKMCLQVSFTEYITAPSKLNFIPFSRLKRTREYQKLVIDYNK